MREVNSRATDKSDKSCKNSIRLKVFIKVLRWRKDVSCANYSGTFRYFLVIFLILRNFENFKS